MYCGRCRIFPLVQIQTLITDSYAVQDFSFGQIQDGDLSLGQGSVPRMGTVPIWERASESESESGSGNKPLCYYLCMYYCQLNTTRNV